MTSSSQYETRPDVIKGLASGIIGGLVASWTMDQFQYAWMKIANNRAREEESSSTKKQESTDEPATAKAAEIVSKNVFKHELASSEKKTAGAIVHYATGGTSGAVYGVAAELAPEVTVGAGIAFGTAVWAVVDEGAVPLFGLSKGPTEYPLSTHMYALASHFVFGITTEVVRRTLRKTILS
jgi:uncharacterized membrane protein YagU involved in acid resistance